jgi:hypothetical protein
MEKLQVLNQNELLIFLLKLQKQTLVIISHFDF